MKRIFESSERALEYIRSKGAESYQYGVVNDDDNTVAIIGFDIYGVHFLTAYYRI